MNASNMANLCSVVVAFAVLFVSTLATKYKPGDKVCSHDYKLNYFWLHVVELSCLLLKCIYDTLTRPLITIIRHGGLSMRSVDHVRES